MSDKPSRRQIVFSWIMGEDLADHDGYWAGSDGVLAVDELLSALDVAAEAALAELRGKYAYEMQDRMELNGSFDGIREQLRIANEENAKLREERDEYKWMYEGLCK